MKIKLKIKMKMIVEYVMDNYSKINNIYISMCLTVYGY